MWSRYISPNSLDEAMELLAEHRGQARIVAGATDLLLEMERGLRTGVTVLVDITRVPGLDEITLDDDGWVHIGPLVTHNQVAASKTIRQRAFALARASWEVGSPQIRNRATVAGNLITASPANDTISPLMALNAQLTLRSKSGERVVPLDRFYTGVRRTVMADDEVLTDVAFHVAQDDMRSTFIKYALRKAQAISVVNAAVVLTLDDGMVRKAAITLGAVAPTILRVAEAEAALEGKDLSEESIDAASSLAAAASRPIDDLRASARYRRAMVKVMVQRALRALRRGDEQAGFPESPVMLRGSAPRAVPKGSLLEHRAGSEISTTINGDSHVFRTGFDKSLLRLLREEGHLTGTKEGCAEGECGACTVFLDGAAVMACMVPAPRAHGARIETVEGLAKDGRLHPVQQAFVDTGAVQCGYCTPGFIMAGVKLLEERAAPTRSEIEQAFAGNLCRCTGYYSIIEAIERAATLSGQAG